MKRRNLLKSLLVATLVCTTVSFASESIAVKGNKKSKIYHKTDCRHFNAKGSTEAFSSETEAIKAGYKACKKCGLPKTKPKQKTEKKADAPKEK